MKNLQRSIANIRRSKYSKPAFIAGISLAVLTVSLGILSLSLRADTTTTASFQAEAGTRSGSANIVSDASAAGGSAIQFGSGSVTEPTALCTGASNWSDTATWGGNIPTANATITIPAGKKVKVDIDVPYLTSITIPSGTELCFPDRATVFSAKQIIVMGKLSAGTPANRLNSDVTIRLQGGVNGVDNYVATGQAATGIAAYNSAHGGDCIPDTGQCISISTNMGTNILTALNGGVIEMYGKDRGRTWSKLAANTNPGANTITLMEAVNWQPGDVIVIASGDMDPAKAEKATVQNVSTDGKTITLSAALTNRHAGTNTCLTSGAESRCVEERSEVGLLSRNVKVTGPTNTPTTGFGGHTIVLPGGEMRIEDIEMYDMGQEGVLGRYPLHYHILGDAGSKSSVKDVALHDNPNRQITLHGTNNLRVEGMVAYKTIGHSVMLEDGNEIRNVFVDNLVMNSMRYSDVAKRLRVSDDFPAEFWMTHPDNDMIGNSAAGGQGSGIWYDFGYTDNFNTFRAQVAPMGIFDDNIAHSHLFPGTSSNHVPGSGIMFDNYFGTAAARRTANNNNAWKNESFGYWIDGLVDFTNSKAANNGIGYNPQDTAAKGGIFLGDTANTAGDLRFLTGLIRFYHGQADIDDVWLGNFQTKTGSNEQGMSAFNDAGAGVTDPANRIKNIKFFGPGYRVYHIFCGTGNNSGDCYFGSTHGGNDHYIEDLDGSILGDGVPAIITNATPYLRHPQSKIVHPNIQDHYYGLANRGLWTPLDRTFMRVTFPGSDDNPVRVVRDGDGVINDTKGWTNMQTGKRYFLQTAQNQFNVHTSNPGWVELYMNRSSSPSKVGKGGYNSSSHTAQPKASSLANLGKDGVWWWENGKLYIRVAITGDPIPFGKGGDYGNLSVEGRGNNYWSVQ